MDTSPIISSSDSSAVSTKISQLEMQAASFDYMLQQAIKHGDSFGKMAIQAKLSKLDLKLQEFRGVSEVQGIVQKAQNAGIAGINPSVSTKAAADTTRGTSISISV